MTVELNSTLLGKIEERLSMAELDHSRWMQLETAQVRYMLLTLKQVKSYLALADRVLEWTDVRSK